MSVLKYSEKKDLPDALSAIILFRIVFVVHRNRGWSFTHYVIYSLINSIIHSFVAQIENLEHVNPATLCQIGLLCMVKEDVSWQCVIDRWISKKPEREADLLRSLCDRYVGQTLEFLSASTPVPPHPGAPPTKTKYKSVEHAVCTSEINMVQTLIALVDVSITNVNVIT